MIGGMETFAVPIRFLKGACEKLKAMFDLRNLSGHAMLTRVRVNLIASRKTGESLTVTT
jgi:hypothetical protein